MANKSRYGMFFEQSVSRGWQTTMGIYDNTALANFETLLTGAFDNTALLKNTPKDYVIKLPDTNAVVRLMFGNDTTNIRLGTGYSGGVVQNETTDQPFTPYGQSVSSTLTYRGFAFFGPTGVSINISKGDSYGNQWWTNHTVGFAAVMNSAGTAIDPNLLLFWNGSYSMGNTGEQQTMYRRGKWLRVGLYDVAQNQVLDRADMQFPVMFFNQFVRSVDTQQSKLYGIKTYSPFPDYREVPFFRVFAPDAGAQGSIQTAERSYLLFDQQQMVWDQFHWNWPQVAPAGNTGLLAFHWQP